MKLGGSASSAMRSDSCCDAIASTSSTSSPSKRRRRCPSPAMLGAGLAAAIAAISLNPAAVGVEALELSLAQGEAHRLRTRSPAYLQDWALAERQRIVGRYGPAAAGVAQGLQPLKKRKREHERSLDARQVIVEPSGSTSRAGNATATSTRSSAATSTSAASGVTAPNNRTINPRTGYADLTNYQSDLCATALVLPHC